MSNKHAIITKYQKIGHGSDKLIKASGAANKNHQHTK